MRRTHWCNKRCLRRCLASCLASHASTALFPKHLLPAKHTEAWPVKASQEHSALCEAPGPADKTYRPPSAHGQPRASPAATPRSATAATLENHQASASPMCRPWPHAVAAHRCCDGMLRHPRCIPSTEQPVAHDHIRSGAAHSPPAASAQGSPATDRKPLRPQWYISHHTRQTPAHSLRGFARCRARHRDGCPAAYPLQGHTDDSQQARSLASAVAPAAEPPAAQHGAHRGPGPRSRC